MRVDPRLVLIGLLIAGEVYAGKKVISMVRGIRNNNPGNIRLSGTVWNGQVPQSQQTDPEYVQFSSPEYGIRAMARIIRSYQARGLTSVADIIRTWAPPSENDTASYVASVAGKLGIGPDVPISGQQLPALIDAIIRHENGIQPYDGATLTRGIAMA